MSERSRNVLIIPNWQSSTVNYLTPDPGTPRIPASLSEMKFALFAPTYGGPSLRNSGVFLSLDKNQTDQYHAR